MQNTRNLESTSLATPSISTSAVCIGVSVNKVEGNSPAALLALLALSTEEHTMPPATDGRRPDDVSLGCQKTFVLSAARHGWMENQRLKLQSFGMGAGGGNPRNLALSVVATGSRPITPPSKSAK